MKKVLSTLVAALVAVSFAGMVFAAEPAAAASARTAANSGPTRAIRGKISTAL